MVYDISGKAVPLAQNLQSWAVYSLLDCDSQNKGLSHYQGHIANQGVPHKVFCGELEGEQHCLVHSWLRNFGKYIYPFQGQLLQRLDILGFGNPFVVQASGHPSSLGVYPQSKYAGVGVALIPILKQSLVSSALWLLIASCLSELVISLASSQASMVFLSWSAFPCEQQKSSLLPLVAKQDYQQDFAVLNLASYPYIDYNIHQWKVQAQ